jgi:hypothetical protein
VETCEDSMACCFLLEMLEERRAPRAGKPYGSAYVSHLRSLLDTQEEEGTPKVMNQSLGWSSLIVRSFISSFRFLRLTVVDEGSLDERSVDGSDIRPSPSFVRCHLFDFSSSSLNRELTELL